MEKILLIGLNHKTAPVDIRECLAFSPADTESALEALTADPAIEESVLLSTCNRVEIIMAAARPDEAVAAAKKFLAVYKQVDLKKFENSLYLHRGRDAVRHLFRVASSLDSMMVGEPQILGQLKEAYRSATVKKASGVILNRLLHRAFFVAKRVRSETGIGDHAVSISYAAIELARKIFGALEGKRVLMIGAGEMAELAVEHLIRHRVAQVEVANRTFERAVILARRYKGTPVRMEEVGQRLVEADIIISSTGAPGFVITRDQVKGVRRKRRNRPLFFIDIAVPRDIDPGINRLGNVYVYDIDDLKGVVEENVADRRKEAVKAERIIDEAVIGFNKWYDSLDVVPTIVALREKYHRMARREAAKTLNGIDHLSARDRESVFKMARAIVNKILHEPTAYLKSDGCYGNRAASIDITRKLFNLDNDD